jgi:hypothetical protein
MKIRELFSKKNMLPITVALIAIGLLIILYNGNPKEIYYQNPDDGVTLRIDDNAVPLADGSADGQTPGTRIPAFAQIILPADRTKVGIVLENPKDNTCNFVYELLLTDTGEVLYKSDMIVPGAKIDTVDLKRALTAGEYRAYMPVHTYERDSLKERNGAAIKTTLLVKDENEI